MPIETPFFDAVVGKTASHLWRGYGSALLVELGELTPYDSSESNGRNPSGEITLMIEWSWRISKKSSVVAGSWSDEEKWPEIFRDMVGSTVEAIELFSDLPEILVSFSNGYRIASFMTADGQPQWALISREPCLGSLCVESGELVVQSCG